MAERGTTRRSQRGSVCPRDLFRDGQDCIEADLHRGSDCVRPHPQRSSERSFRGRHVIAGGDLDVTEYRLIVGRGPGAKGRSQALHDLDCLPIRRSGPAVHDINAPQVGTRAKGGHGPMIV
jgi:hypothetical protein